MYPHQIWYTAAPVQGKDQVRIGWPWPHSQGHRGHSRIWHMEDGFRSISERNIWRILTTTGAPGQAMTNFEPGDLDLIARSQRSLKATRYERWLPLSISRSIRRILTKFGAQKAAGRGEYQVWTSWPWPSFHGHEGHLIWFPLIMWWIFYEVSLHLVHRGKKTRRGQGLNLLTLTLKIIKMISAQYLKKYLMKAHQMFYTEAPGQRKDHVQTVWPWPYFQVTKVI